MYFKTAVSTKSSTVLFFIVVFVLLILLYMRCQYINEQRSLLFEYNDFVDEFPYEEYVDFRMRMQEMDDILNMKRQIRLSNNNQKVHNQHLLGPVRKGTTIIVVQIHSRLPFILELLKSLSMVTGITKSLLIFVHDNYNDEINKLVHNVTFAKFMQVFYPYSIQLHPHIFPGNDPKFCSDNFNCIDSYDKRNATLAQIKHSWWWKMNYVFDQLDVTKDYNNPIMFLDDNQYVTEDLIYMLKLLQKLMPVECPECEIISLGANRPSVSQYHIETGYIIKGKLSTLNLKTGIVLDKMTWTKIKQLSHHFCYFNDYGWDNSLLYAVKQRNEGDMFALSTEGARVFPVKVKDITELHRTINDIEEFVKVIRRGLFPRNLVLGSYNRKSKNLLERGYWNDVRDIELCMFFAK